MSVCHIPLERSKYTVLKSEESDYTLFSEKFDRVFELCIFTYYIEKPDVGDVFELPDCMIFYNENNRICRNNLLQFETPRDNPTCPDGFNIEEDYAYLTYKKTNKRIQIERCYG